MKNLLKKSALFIAGVSFASLASATTHVVTVQNFSFTPATFTAVVGDTVEWEWVAGTHTTTSLTIPGGAATWNNNITSSATTFKYKVTVAGTYNYWCAIHQTMMEGSFTVTNPTAVPAVSNSSQVIAKVYPNPATSVVNIHLNIAPGNNILLVNDMLGKEVVRKTLYNMDNTLDVSGWKKGVYIYHLKSNENDLEGKFEVQ
jgi:plastocyanin